jgi:hypothetical protein
MTLPLDGAASAGPGRAARLLLPAILLWLPCLARAESPSEAVERYARLALAEKGIAVQGQSLRAGHLQLRLAQGVAAPILAGRETVGFFFRGSGTWEYVSDAPDEFAVLAHNAKEVSHWKPTVAAARATIIDEFSELLWVSTGIDRPSFDGAESASPAADFKKHLDRFARLGTESLAQRLAYRSLSGSGKSFAWGQLTGGKNDALFFFDAVGAGTEQLAALKKIDAPGFNLEGEYQVLPISRQPISGKFREPARVSVGLSRVEVEVEAEGEVARIRTRETFLARDEPLRVLKLDLRNHVWEVSRRDPRVQRLLRVRAESGAELPFDHRRGTALVALPQPVAPGQSVTIEFQIGGDVLYRPSGNNYWLLGFENWYPNPGLGASAFTWLCQVKVKKPFVPLASGREIERRTDGDWNILRTEFENPVFLPIVMAGDYKIHVEVRDGRTIRVAGYAFAHEYAFKQMTNLADQIIHFYEGFLGPFPWKELTIIEINEYGFGVAPPATMFITQEAFQPIRDDYTRLFSKGLNERYAHEIAHQYWGHQVKWASPEDEWLSESFAEYCAALFIRRLRGEGAYKDIVAYWRSRAKEVGAKGTIGTANRVLGEQDFEDRTRLLYDKGPYLLSVLHRQLGEEKFLRSLMAFQATLKGKFGSTALFQELLQYVDKKSYADFFDQNFWGTGLPDAPK